MSHAQTPSEPKQGNKVIRLLGSIGKKARRDDKDPVRTQSFKSLFDKNVVADIYTLYRPHFIQLPDKLQLTIDVEFSARNKDFDYLESEGVAPFVQQKAQDMVADALKPIVAELKISDRMVGAGYNKENEAIKELESSIALAEQKTSTDMAVLLEQAVRAFVGDKKRLTSFRIKSAAKIVTSTISIVGSAVHAGLSWGATSPLAIVSIVRASIVIVQTVGELAAKAEHMATLIMIDFRVLDTIISTAKDAKTPQATKLKNDAAEIGMTALASITGLKLPSVENCGKRIEVFRTKITEIEIKVQELSRAVREAMDLNAELEKAIIVKSNSKLKQAFGDNGKGLTVVLDKIIGLNGQIVAGHAQTQEFEERLKEFKDAKHGWTKWAGVVFDFAVDAGLNAGAVHQEGTEAVEVMNAIIERTMEVVSAAASGAIDVIADET